MRTAPRYLAVLAGLLLAHTVTSTGQELPESPYRNDPRLLKIQSFFQSLDSPAYYLAEDFLVAADRNGLDWRLLPSISILESGGGKAYQNNNILGWDSCQRRFQSVAHGIHTVARFLATSKLYKDKSLERKLHTYNPHPGYSSRVKSLMARMERR